MLSAKNTCNYLTVVFCLQIFYWKTHGEDVFPRGHMQPLGAHRDPDPVEERSVDQLPTPLEFWNDFLMPSKAVVFRGAAKKFPGASLWTDSYLMVSPALSAALWININFYFIFPHYEKNTYIVSYLKIQFLGLPQFPPL